MKDTMRDLSFLTNAQMEKIKQLNTFTADELYIIEHLRKQDKTDLGIRLELGLNKNKYYDIKVRLEQKLIITGL